MLVGLAPWHYGNRPSSSAMAATAGGSISSAGGDGPRPPSFVNPGMDHGAAQYPKFVSHLLQRGWTNVSQMMPAELCGLV
jgi:hypothetical protein